MKAERRTPCPNCPFRKDAKLAYWDPEEYRMLQEIEDTQADPSEGFRLFQCHKDRREAPEERELCVGWLIYQRENGIPSLALRLKLMREPAAVTQYHEADADGELYGTIKELVKANLERDRELHPERYLSDLLDKDVS